MDLFWNDPNFPVYLTSLLLGVSLVCLLYTCFYVWLHYDLKNSSKCEKSHAKIFDKSFAKHFRSQTKFYYLHYTFESSNSKFFKSRDLVDKKIWDQASIGESCEIIYLKYRPSISALSHNVSGKLLFNMMILVSVIAITFCSLMSFLKASELI